MRGLTFVSGLRLSLRSYLEYGMIGETLDSAAAVSIRLKINPQVC